MSTPSTPKKNQPDTDKRFQLRIDDALQRRLRAGAGLAGQGINAFILRLIDENTPTLEEIEKLTHKNT